VFHHSNVGNLEWKLEEEVGDCNNLPTSVVGVSFCFGPSHDVHYNGVYASSRKGMQLAHGSSISRHLRNTHQNCGVYWAKTSARSTAHAFNRRDKAVEQISGR